MDAEERAQKEAAAQEQHRAREAAAQEQQRAREAAAQEMAAREAAARKAAAQEQQHRMALAQRTRALLQGPPSPALDSLAMHACGLRNLAVGLEPPSSEKEGGAAGGSGAQTEGGSVRAQQGV